MKADWRPQKYRLIPKWGAAPFAAVFSPLGAPSGKCTIWPLGYQPPKRGQIPSAGAVYGKMTPQPGHFSHGRRDRDVRYARTIVNAHYVS